MSDGDEHADIEASRGKPHPRDLNAPLESPAPVESSDPLESPGPRDQRLNEDPFAPPQVPCECHCLNCGRTFMSSAIWLQRIKNATPGEIDGFWMCPTPNCDGKGFTFDIFPTDPDHPANEGWSDDDDDEADEFADDDSDDWDDEPDDIAAAADEDDQAVYDPDEATWKLLDAQFGGDDEDDDIEGEEWKYGLAPGESLPEPDWLGTVPRQRDEQQARYDQPDERPREIEWDYGRKSDDDDDIPF